MVLTREIKLSRCKDCKSIKKKSNRFNCFNENIVRLYIKDKKIPRGSKNVETNPSGRACRWFEPRDACDAFKHGKLF